MTNDDYVTVIAGEDIFSGDDMAISTSTGKMIRAPACTPHFAVARRDYLAGDVVAIPFMAASGRATYDILEGDFVTTDDDQIRETIVKAAEVLGMDVISPDDLKSYMEAGKLQKEQSDDDARAAGKIFLDEEQNADIIKGWYEAARNTEIDSLLGFVYGLINDYRHDYGTIVRAISAAAIAAQLRAQRGDEGEGEWGG